MSSGLYNLNKVEFDKTLDLTKLKAYGDTMNDGKVQISFTLPVKNDERGELSAFFVGGLSILRCRIFHRFIITFDEKNVKIP